MPDSNDRVFFQMYSTAPMDPETFRVDVDLYGDAEEVDEDAIEAEHDRMVALGVVFFRDEDHNFAPLFEPPPDLPKVLHYSQVAYDIETGEIVPESWVHRNSPCMVQWMTQTRVHRVFTEPQTTKGQGFFGPSDNAKTD